MLSVDVSQPYEQAYLCTHMHTCTRARAHTQSGFTTDLEDRWRTKTQSNINTPMDYNIMKILSATLFNVEMGWGHYTGFVEGQHVLAVRQPS
jgi:hypothetical protein